MSEAQVLEAIEDFGEAAATARALGFDAVEVMASEGYLINQFCSPLTNRRDDDWGGDAERRRRFALAVLDAVRAAGLPVIFRLSGADLMEGSSSHEEVLDLARALAAGGADALNVGIGWHESRVPTVQAIVPEGMWVGVACAVKEAVGELPVMASNRVDTLEAADRVLLVVPAELRAAAAAARVAATVGPHCPDISVVVRGPAPSDLTAADVARALGLPLAGALRPEPGLARGLEHGDPPASAGRGPLATLCRHILSDVVRPAGRAAA
jgi:hypothetical protein